MIANGFLSAVHLIIVTIAFGQRQRNRDEEMKRGGEGGDCLPAPLHTSRSHPCFLLPPPPSHSISLFFFLLLFLVAWFIHHFTKANHGIDFPSLHPPPCKAKHEAFMGLFPVRLKPSRRKFKGRGRFNYAVIYISRVLDWLGHSLPVWALLAYPCHVSSWHDCG